MIKETPYILDCIKSDIKKSHKQNSELQNEEKEQQQSSSSKEDDDITKLSFFSEQDLLAIIDNESKFNLPCIISHARMCEIERENIYLY